MLACPEAPVIVTLDVGSAAYLAPLTRGAVGMAVFQVSGCSVPHGGVVSHVVGALAEQGEADAGGRVFASLVVLVAGGLFVAGFLAAVQVVAAATRRRERRLVRERQALNAVWRRLREQFGIERVPWLEDFLQRPEYLERKKRR
jgi:hypothetical protein